MHPPNAIGLAFLGFERRGPAIGHIGAMRAMRQRELTQDRTAIHLANEYMTH